MDIEDLKLKCKILMHHRPALNIDYENSSIEELRALYLEEIRNIKAKDAEKERLTMFIYKFMLLGGLYKEERTNIINALGKGYSSVQLFTLYDEYSEIFSNLMPDKIHLLNYEPRSMGELIDIIVSNSPQEEVTSEVLQQIALLKQFEGIFTSPGCVII